MWFGVLGPLDVRDEADLSVHIGGPVRRQLLAALLCRQGRAAPAAALLDDLWGEAPPRSAAQTLRSHIVRLRDDLGRGRPSLLSRDASGYRLDVQPEDVDAMAFEVAVQRMAGMVVQDDREAIRSWDLALALWRGEAYADFPDAAFAVRERVRLGELRSWAREQRTDRALALGQAPALVSELEARVAAEPYRERGWEQLVLALYGSGRQADALGAFGRARDVLASELGIDPGPGLRDLEVGILRQELPATPPTTALAALAPLPGPAPPGAASPYVGLVPYTEHDAGIFVGRERQVPEVCSLLAERSLVVITGASGSGKSSLARAGVVAALRRGAVPGSASWRIAVRTPTAQAMTSGATDLVVLDQAEEMFTVLSAGERTTLVGDLSRAMAEGGRLLIVIRGDHYGRLADSPALAAHAEGATVLVGALRDTDLARVLTEPPSRFGVAVEPELVDAVLDEMRGAPAALPMLSSALAQVWQARTSDALTLRAYRASGGIARAIESAAEAAYERLADSQRSQARSLLVHLASWRDGAWSRRALALEEARLIADPEVIAALVDTRLLTKDQVRVEVAHEALLVHWPRLAGWLEERRVAADLLEHLAIAEHAWRQGGARVEDLYRGGRLDDAQELSQTRPQDLSKGEIQFLHASRAAATSELTEARRRADREAAGRRRLRRLAVGLVAAVAVAAATAGVSLAERAAARRESGRADLAATAAEASKVAAESVNASDRRTALLLAAAAYRIEDSPDTRAALLSALVRSGGPSRIISTANRLQWVAASSDGRTVWAMDNRRIVMRFDTTGRSEGDFPARADRVVAISPDDRSILAVGPADYVDPAGATRGIVLDAITGAVRQILPTPAVDAGLGTATWTADGRLLAVVEPVPGHPDQASDTIAVYRQPDLGTPHLVHLRGAVTGIAASRDAVLAVTAAGEVDQVGTAGNLGRSAEVSVLRDPTAPPSPVPFAASSDGRHLVAASGSTAYAIDLTRPTDPPAVLAEAATPVTSVAISPVTGRIAIGRQTGEVDVLSAAGSLLRRESGNTGQVMSVTWGGSTAATERLYAGGLDSQVVAYEISATPPLLRLSAAAVPYRGDLQSTATHLVGITADEGAVPESQIAIWVADKNGSNAHVIPLHLGENDSISNIAVDAHDTRILVSAQHDRGGQVSLRLYDLASGRLLNEFYPTRDKSPHQTFLGIISADGKTAAASIGPHRLATFALPSGRLLTSVEVSIAGPQGARSDIIPNAMLPDGRILVGGVDPGGPAPPPPGPASMTVPTRDFSRNLAELVVDPRTGRSTGQVSLGSSFYGTAAAISPDGRYASIGTVSGILGIIDLLRMQPVAQAVHAANGPVNTLDYDSDGRTIVSAGSDSTLQLWDATSGRPLGGPIPLGGGTAYAWFDARGDVTGWVADPDATGIRSFTFPGRPAEWLTSACSIAGNDLTREEWTRYVGDRPYAAVCRAP